ncbi:MAG: YbaB/EbfC family nucleoid-associated protein [Alteromonadaceae bacterium]|nr:MAG: YbaB/EbfC family nucleoid-associated protein [Alteromonadaceae bacterium]
MKGLGDLMKQAQQMQQKMAEAQEELGKKEVTGNAGAGMVEIVMTGRYDVRRVKISDELLGEDKEILEDLVAAAVNDAVRNVEQLNQDSLGGVASGMGIPPGFKMPF